MITETTILSIIIYIIILQIIGRAILIKMNKEKVLWVVKIKDRW